MGGKCKFRWVLTVAAAVWALRRAPVQRRMGGWVDASTCFHNNHSPALISHLDIKYCWLLPATVVAVYCCRTPFASIAFNSIEPFSCNVIWVNYGENCHEIHHRQSCCGPTRTFLKFSIANSSPPPLLPSPLLRILLPCDDIPHFRILFLISFQCCKISQKCRMPFRGVRAHF